MFRQVLDPKEEQETTFSTSETSWKNVESIIALNRLKKSLIDFDSYQGKLAPHFAYGELTKDEYEAAHVMHLYNHLQEIIT